MNIASTYDILYGASIISLFSLGVLAGMMLDHDFRNEILKDWRKS